MQKVLMEIYHRLFQAFGPRRWWPGETPFEVMVGAILTQNTSWRNVEKAIAELKAKGVLTPKGVHQLRKPELEKLIRSSGFYRLKAERLKRFVDFLFDAFGGDIERMKATDLRELRRRLLGLNGIGPETCDSILLYGLEKPIFVVDAYTKRILSRHGLVGEKASYEEVQRLFMDHLPTEEKLFNEYHALLVRLAKSYCLKKPNCAPCPLRTLEVQRRRLATKKDTLKGGMETGSRKKARGKRKNHSVSPRPEGFQEP